MESDPSAVLFCHIHDRDKEERLRFRRDDLQKYKIFGPLLRCYLESCGKSAPNERVRLTLKKRAEAEADTLDLCEDRCLLKPHPSDKLNPSEGRVLGALDLSGDDPRICQPEVKIKDDDVPPLFEALNTQPGIVSLDLRFNRIGDDGAVVIAKFIRGTDTLRELNLMGNDIHAVGGVDLAFSLCHNDVLLRLRLNGNPLGAAGGEAFATALTTNKRLVSLDLGDTELKTGTIIAFAGALSANNTLKAINLDNPRLFSLQEETTIHVAKMLRQNRSLLEIHLRKHRMGDFGADWIADNLRHNGVLKVLDLSCNEIDDEGCHSLSLHLLQQDTPLETLELSTNRIRDNGAFHLANALLKNKRLKALGLANNKIGNAGLMTLFIALKHNCSLESILLCGNSIGDEAAKAFKELIDCERLNLKDVDLQPYESDGWIRVGRLTRGINVDYYWTPYFGERSKARRKTRTIEGGLEIPEDS